MSGGFAVVLLIGGAALYLFEIKSPPPTAPASEQSVNMSSHATHADVAPAPAAPRAPAGPSPDRLAWDFLKDTSDDAALKRFVTQYPDSPLRKDAEARIAALDVARTTKPPEPPPVRPDEAAWGLLKDTTDDAALKRFAAEYPDSPLRKDAEARIATLGAAQTPKPPVVSADEAAWAWLKDTTDEAALRRFIDQYPDSAWRKDAEARVAALDAAQPAKSAPSAPASAIDPHELARSLQFELKRVGCFDAAVNGEYDDATKAAWRKFAKLAAVGASDELSPDAIKAIRQIDKRVCPLTCPAGQHAADNQCIANATTAKATETAPHRAAPAPTPRANGKCFAFQGRQFCE